MDREIFENWFHTHFVPQVKAFLKERGLPQKVVLLLDNAPSHSRQSLLTSDDGLIIVTFLPPNVTAIIQPMDQGVIASMKCCYWAYLLRTFAAEDDNITASWKKMTVMDAIYSASWA
jgi:hypothetical protein